MAVEVAGERYFTVFVRPPPGNVSWSVLFLSFFPSQSDGLNPIGSLIVAFLKREREGVGFQPHPQESTLLQRKKKNSLLPFRLAAVIPTP